MYPCTCFPKQTKLFATSDHKEDYLVMPEVGDMAPDFELKSHLEKDKKVKLSDFRGKQNVVLAFYPLAWTPV
jgi:peroxiredoxin